MHAYAHVKPTGGKVAILGGGMAGLTAAWRLSEPGWRDRFEAITVYQRGWRLGGKGASSRGENGRIEEHGLHIWLGCYENAFALLRECYAELDRAITDPAAPIHRWDQAIIPADKLGLAEEWGTSWLTWLGTFARNDMLPGDPSSTGRAMSVVAFLERAVQLVVDFADSQQDARSTGLTMTASAEPPPAQPSRTIEVVQRALLAALFAFSEPEATQRKPTEALDAALEAVRNDLEYERDPAQRRSWLLISFVTAAIRGILADNIVTDPRGMRAINDEDFGHWIVRHGGHPDVPSFPLVRGLYDLVFGYEDADPDRPAFGAGLMLFLIGLVLFEYKGAIFWKMTAGMGDIVMAPLYQALRRRGVEFEFFSRVDALHVDDDKRGIDEITMTRQARVAGGVRRYEPLITVRGLPVFPAAPLTEQLDVCGQRDLRDCESLETYWASDDVGETRLMRRGIDFDHVVLAVSLGMLSVVAAELIADRAEWQDMTRCVRTVATQAFQIWLDPDEPSLGWAQPAVTISAYKRPFETWASMPQTLWAEDWPETDRPGTVAYFCGSLDAPWPSIEKRSTYARTYDHRVRLAAANYIDRNLAIYFPNAFGDNGFDWRLLKGAGAHQGIRALNTQHVSVNIDPSDRYVQSLPGTDKYRLRPDESGYDNLVLAGDWTDSGINAGCIESAVMSGLEAANALLGRSRFYRLRGFYLP
ncbi:MAG: hypothetical protein QOH57_3471 [Mycobacterium sp.]|nr:hypothetical protein [Mycobacterium sp.]